MKIIIENIGKLYIGREYAMKHELPKQYYRNFAEDIKFFLFNKGYDVDVKIIIDKKDMVK